MLYVGFVHRFTNKEIHFMAFEVQVNPHQLQIVLYFASHPDSFHFMFTSVFHPQSGYARAYHESFTTITQVSCITTFSFLSCSTEPRAKWPWLCLTQAPLPCHQVRALPGHCFSVASVHRTAPIDACNRGFRVIRAIASRFGLPDRPCRETSNLVTVTPHRQKKLAAVFVREIEFDRFMVSKGT